MTGDKISPSRLLTPTSSASRSHVLSETVFLAVICMLDTISTVYLVAQGHAVEANPILAWSFNYGMVGFVVAKTLTFLPALIILERLRVRHEAVVRRGLRLGIFVYVVGYCLLSLIANAKFIGLN